METGQVNVSMRDKLDPLIHRSWERCAPLLDPWAKPRFTALDGHALDRVLIKQANLLSTAYPLIDDVHQFAEGSGFAVLLTDATVCLLEVSGERSWVTSLGDRGLRAGAYWDEGRMGTNALALALLEAVPVQVVGAEHFFQIYHDLTCSAAPIHDTSGHIVGSLAMVGPQQARNSHTLTAVMAAARAISNQLQTNTYLQEANRRLAELNSVFGAISEGVISWDQNRKITHVNAQAGEILHIKPEAVTGRHLEEVLQLPPTIAEAIEGGGTLPDAEASFGVNGQFINCLVNLRPILEGAQGPVGYIATLRPIERVRQLVHRLVGAQATLTLEDVQGDSTAIRQARRQARIAARGTAPVLLLGEDGVGKNPLARAIHNQSERAEYPFIAINCLALPHELMITEFLGYEGGAFSWALAEGRPSKFELADGGTLFLDEVDALSLEMQAALLQVIETGHVTRLGGVQPIPVNVRIIATSTANLEQQAAEGSFLPHLYRRFGAFVIDLPSLRNRVEDIPLLVERFLARITQRIDCAAFITDEALEILKRYPWPGNVREMENVLERAVAASEDGTIREQDLPAGVRHGQVLPPGTLHPQPVLSIPEAEYDAIIRAGWACRGQVTAMAQQLGVSRTTLWRKMKSFDINPQDFKR
jgi:transcriptional activator for dhaKLM operon